MCVVNTRRKKGYWLKNNLQPIWYERTDDGNFRLDDAGEKIVRYNVPEVLSTLSMRKKLLIRRSSPPIPSLHILNGIYRIKGHCVPFPQDISDMCDELPRRRESVVTFVRQIGNKDTFEMHLKHLRVYRKKIIPALEWLKIHHSGYHDIKIKTGNLSWMKEKNNPHL